MSARFDGEVAIVTGGAGGIGSATCRKLAAEGARVVVADIDPAGAQAVADEIGATAIAFDLGEPDEVERLIAETVDGLGRLDVLVNNAALRSPEAMAADTTIESMDVDGWREMMDVNALGFALACKHAIPHMRAAGGGSIVNISSQQAIVGREHRQRLRRLEGRDHRDHADGRDPVRSATASAATPSPPASSGPPGSGTTPGSWRRSLPHVLLGRVGEPEDVADLICYLASREAAYITGQLYNVDGGYLAHMPAPG